LGKINSLPHPTGEFGGAIPISTAVILIFFTGYFFYRLNGDQSSLKIRNTRYKFFNLTYLTLFLCVCFILKDFRGYNIWSYTFYELPFLGSIRVLSRFMLLACLLIPFLLAYCVEEFIGKKASAAKSICCWLCLIFTFFVQGTQTYGTFSQSDLDSTISVEKDVRENCRSFYLIAEIGEEKSIPVYLPPDIAIQIAVNSGVPTINGNSSFLPSYYPRSLFYQSDRNETLNALSTWVSKFNLRDVCLISVSLNTNLPYFKVIQKLESTS